ncbi:MAG: DUF1840 domain-containing protein, partial [Gammaproteobacteria bacterium]|nr:DUF1840 domain-containing protein [Gammaproteobacteria bacterium]NIR95455.1 DUF1840 domain-containing protein [Gammaproteobacteria bacterium]NIW44248.1 DUF1840 family protein [Gammaproteobacteria bacterium]NIX55403.1 DUF1840 family protein [candidate division Zixibacteria bacterium]
MLVVFSSKAHGDVMMFGDVAKRLLKMMGMTGNIPGAVNGEDVAKALATLEEAVNADRDAAAEQLDE